MILWSIKLFKDFFGFFLHGTHLRMRFGISESQIDALFRMITLSSDTIGINLEEIYEARDIRYSD